MGDFLTIFAYKFFNIDVETTKIITKMQIMGRITKKFIDMKIFVKIGQNLTKNVFFYKNAIYSKLQFE